MFVLMVLVNSYSAISGLVCMVCLLFLFFESAFGICLGCKFYKLFYKEKVQYCPGEVCEVKDKQEIQKTSLVQVLVMIAFIGYIILAAYLFNDQFRKRPHDLFRNAHPAQSK
jgi:hypothetical protein